MFTDFVYLCKIVLKMKKNIVNTVNYALLVITICNITGYILVLWNINFI